METVLSITPLTQPILPAELPSVSFSSPSLRVSFRQVMKQYITSNHLPEKFNDTLTTGDIDDFVIEGLNVTGVARAVIIELSHPIPADAVLRKYSLTNGWSNFVTNDFFAFSCK
jgi:hypothetical protein